MTAADVVGVAVGGMTIAGAVGAGAAWLMKVYIRDAVAEIRGDTKQLQRNGGSTVADASAASRDLSRETLEAVGRLDARLTTHMIDEAGRSAAADAKIQVLMERR